MTVDKFHGGSNHGAERRDRERQVVTRKRMVTLGVIFILFILFLGETSLQKVMVVHNWSTQLLSNEANHFGCQNLHLHGPQSFSPSKLLLITRPTVQDAYKTHTTYGPNLTSRTRPTGEDFRTVIEPNRNFKQFGLTVVRNACLRPDGPIVMIGLSGDEILRQVSKVPELEQDWFLSYNSSQKWSDGVGFEEMAVDQVPADFRWVPGTTTHIIPHLGNVFHHFADRLWPHIAGFQYPLNETTAHPIDHFLVHRFSTWLLQAGHNMDRNTLMYQIRILGLLADGADFLVMDELEQQELVCYERLLLACATCDRMSTWLGSNITRPALLRYRQAALSYFGIGEPAIPLPPRKLRVTFYARGDTTRRRIANGREVVEHLRRYTSPPLDVTFVDELLAAGEYNQSLPEVVSLFAQTDIFITVHGANTWAALFMPKHSGVIEIEGPCGPFSWLQLIVDAVELKHDTSNPWGEKVASPDAGNVTVCEGPYQTPDFTVDVRKLDAAIHQLALPTFGFNDILTRHWLHNRS